MTRTERISELKERFLTGARLPVSRIASDYQISEKTAGRDLRQLEAMGVILEKDCTSDAAFWYVRPADRKIDVRYSISDVMALFTARRCFDFLENTSMEDALNRVYAQIETRLANTKDLDNAKKLQQKVYLIHEGPKKLKAKSRAVLDEVLTALLLERKLKVTYRNAKDVRQCLTLCPYTLTVYKRGLYLTAAMDTGSGQVRIFALERIIRADWLKKESFKYPKDWCPITYFKNALFIVPGKPQQVVLHFTPSTKRYIEIRAFHPSQKLKTLADGTVQMTLKVPVSFELVNWLLSFGPHVNVVSPQSLRQQVAGQLQAALAQYSPETGKQLNDAVANRNTRDTLTMDLFKDLEG
ncbi:MAG: WYL domain-containing protein [Deltaproteobacteria bacterium]|nr:WYL domain-containing protein [Deltaproteobacteria bacterium]